MQLSRLQKTTKQIFQSGYIFRRCLTGHRVSEMYQVSTGMSSFSISKTMAGSKIHQTQIHVNTQMKNNELKF